MPRNIAEDRARIRAGKEYDLANNAARTANTHAGLARDARRAHAALDERLRHWDSIMSTAPTLIFTVVFVVVAVVEYLISRELYREFPGNAPPWLIALAFVAMAIVVSELIVLFLWPVKRVWKRYELRRDPNHEDLLDEELDARMARITKRQFWWGLLLGILLCLAVLWLSMARVDRELEAGLRTNGFGWIDFLPVVLYAVEMITGVFLWYLIKRLFYGTKRRALHRRFTKAVAACAESTALAVGKFEDARNAGADLSDLSDNVREALYRDRHRDHTDGGAYVAACEEGRHHVALNLLGPGGTPLEATVTVRTEFWKYASSGTEQGRVKLDFKTFDEDSVCLVRAVMQGGGTQEVQGNFALDTEDPHVIRLNAGTAA